MKKFLIIYVFLFSFVSCIYDPLEALMPEVFLHAKITPETIEKCQDCYLEIFVPNDDDYYIVIENKEECLIDAGKIIHKLEEQQVYIIESVEYNEKYRFCKIRFNFSEEGNNVIKWGGISKSVTNYEENIFEQVLFKNLTIFKVQ
jgi:hypothetical protein